ncbi:hypothetical protein M758_6G167700 [Ceratodon purpureus]|nr:hypothetical protein M758_6G167700 [Ceratodon purpureus]
MITDDNGMILSNDSNDVCRKITGVGFLQMSLTKWSKFSQQFHPACQ